MQKELSHNAPFLGHKNSELLRTFKICDKSDGKPCPSCQEYININEEINKLLARQHELLIKINYHHDPISSRFPAEIGARIFECYVEDYCHVTQNHDTRPSRQPIFSPLSIGAVCKDWRRIAWSSPQIWTHMQVIRQNIIETDMEVIQQWLTRSGQLPLSWRIQFRFHDNCAISQVRKKVRRFLSTVNQHSHRWQDLYLSFPLPDYYRYVCPNPLGAPLLRKLRLENLNNRTEFIHFGIRDVKPRPFHVSLKSVALRFLDIDWNHLTKLRMSEVDIELHELIQLLQRAPMLEDCRFDYIHFTGMPTLPANPPTIHHKICSLILSGFTGNVTELISGNSVRFPCLIYLTFTPGSHLVLNNVSVLIETSRPQLTRLFVDVPKSEYDILLSILAATPSLHELRLTSSLDMNDHKRLFRSLSKTTSDTEGSNKLQFLPVLQSFHYSSITMIPWDDASFWQLLLSLIAGSNGGNGDSKDHRRLTNIQVQSYEFFVPPNESPRCDNKEILIHILKLSESGTSIDLIHNGVDMLEVSRKYHRIT